MEVNQDGPDFELRGTTHPRPRHNTKPASDDTMGLEEFSSFYREEGDEVVFAGGRPRERPRETLEPHGSTRWVGCCVPQFVSRMEYEWLISIKATVIHPSRPTLYFVLDHKYRLPVKRFRLDTEHPFAKVPGSKVGIARAIHPRLRKL